jgi:hypothetical protein
MLGAARFARSVSPHHGSFTSPKWYVIPTLRDGPGRGESDVCYMGVARVRPFVVRILALLSEAMAVLQTCNRRNEVAEWRQTRQAHPAGSMQLDVTVVKGGMHNKF